MKKIMVVCLVFCFVLLYGCSHYKNAVPLTGDTQSAIKENIGVAGVLNCQVKDRQPFLCKDSTERLAKDSGFPNYSEKMTPDDLALLLADPLTLSVYGQQLGAIRQRLGSRYILAGKHGAHAVSSYTIWHVIVVIPIPPVVAWFTIPVPISAKHGLLSSEQVLRIVDLEQAKVVSESYSLLRDYEADGILSSSEITDGLSRMMLLKEKIDEGAN